MSWFFECGQQNNKRNCLRNTANFLGIQYFFVWFFWLKKTRENSNLILIFLHNWVFFDSILTPLLNTAPMCFWILVKQLFKLFGSLEELPWECFQLLDLRRDVEANWRQEDFFLGSAELLLRLPKPRLHNHGPMDCLRHAKLMALRTSRCSWAASWKSPKWTFFRKLEVDKIAKAMWRDRNW